MAFGKKNIPSTNIFDYNLCLLGQSKSGKTTLLYEVLEKAAPDKYLFVETGRERGADAIAGINYVNCPYWKGEYDESENAAGFINVIDDICKNKTEDYPDLKVVVIDTFDQIIELAEGQAVADYNKKLKLDAKPTIDSINAAFGGYGRGEKYAMGLVDDAVERLRRVGVRTWLVGHCKNRDVSDPITGDVYTTITSDMAQSWFNHLKKDVHFLGLLYTDREIVTEKKKVGRGDKEVHSVTNEARKIKWRSDDMATDCGSRFADIVDEIPCDADEFIKALTDAIDAEIHKSGISDKQLKAEQKKLDEAKAKKVAENIKTAADGEELEELKSQIMDWVSENRTEKDKLKPVLSALKEAGVKKPTEIEDIDTAKKIFALCK